MSIEDFKALISGIIDEKLAQYRLVHIDEQGYTYVFTEESLLSLDRGFEAGLEESIKQAEEGQLVDEKKAWAKLGI
jgi:hypothetical protein